jgi:cytidine deaminase
MNEVNNRELIKKAASIVNSRKNGDFIIGGVGCALVTDKNNIYLGVCIDTRSSMGFCAEHNAIGSMVTAGESKIKKIVAVRKDKDDTYVLSPCGRCREFIYQIDENNLNTSVILAEDKTAVLKELLPYYNWFHKI